MLISAMAADRMSARAVLKSGNKSLSGIPGKPEKRHSGAGSKLAQILQVLPSRAAETVDQDGVAEGPLLPVVLHHVRNKAHHRFQAEIQKKNYEQARQSK